MLDGNEFAVACSASVFSLGGLLTCLLQGLLWAFLVSPTTGPPPCAVFFGRFLGRPYDVPRVQISTRDDAVARGDERAERERRRETAARREPAARRVQAERAVAVRDVAVARDLDELLDVLRGEHNPRQARGGR